MEYREPFVEKGEDKWLKFIDILQNKLKLDVYPGGYSAMTGWYHRHYGIFRYHVEDLYGLDTNKIPLSLLKENWERKFNFYKNDFLPINLGMLKIKTRKYKLIIPSVERALLEMIYGLNINTSFDFLYDFFSDLDDLNPKLLQELLENCSSEKIKRLALFLGEEFSFDYYKKLDIRNIGIDVTYNLDYAENSNCPSHIPKYNIEVPGHFDWDVCIHIDYSKTKSISKKLIKEQIWEPNKKERYQRTR